MFLLHQPPLLTVSAFPSLAPSFYIFQMVNKSQEKTEQRVNPSLYISCLPYSVCITQPQTYWILYFKKYIKNKKVLCLKKKNADLYPKTAGYCSFLTSVTETGGKGPFVRDYFQWRINPHLVLSVCGQMNYCVCVHEGTCQCNSEAH